MTNAGQPPVVLYSHWGGYELPTAVADALPKAAGRWDDEPYCARIVIQNILNTIADPDSETGSGISVGELTDNEYAIIVIDVPANTVGVVPEKAFRAGKLPELSTTLPFADVTAENLSALRESA